MPPAEPVLVEARPSLIAGTGLFATTDIPAGDVVLHQDGTGALNHSCDPTLGWADAATLVALRDVPAGAELTIDYCTVIDDAAFVLWCHCETYRCRQVIEGTDWQIPQLQLRYAGHWSPAIQQRIDARRIASAACRPAPTVRIVAETLTRELRRSVLRPNLAPGDPLPGDDLPGGVHLAAVDSDGTAVCTCFVYADPCPVAARASGVAPAADGDASGPAGRWPGCGRRRHCGRLRPGAGRGDPLVQRPGDGRGLLRAAGFPAARGRVHRRAAHDPARAHVAGTPRRSHLVPLSRRTPGA